MSLDRGKKPKTWRKSMQAGENKLHTERLLLAEMFKLGNLLLWADNANHCYTVAEIASIVHMCIFYVASIVWNTVVGRNNNPWFFPSQLYHVIVISSKSPVLARLWQSASSLVAQSFVVLWSANIHVLTERIENYCVYAIVLTHFTF